MTDRNHARTYLEQSYNQHPELFPAGMPDFVFNGLTRRSKKLHLSMRKIRIDGLSYRIRPSFVFAYMRPVNAEVSSALFLLRFGVPFWALAFVFGRNAMWYYRLFISLSRSNLVGTTIYNNEAMPSHLLADEHHVRIRGKKGYIATTVGQNCILGVEASRGSNAESLERAYAVFAEEANSVVVDYQPITVNLDGWVATQMAWRALFSKVFIIECFLHAYLKVRNRATKRLRHWYDQAAEKIWEIYRAQNKRSCGQRIRRLRQWALSHVPACAMRDHIEKLCLKNRRWLAHLDFPMAHRTSNMLDRAMKLMDRHGFNAQMFHGSLEATSMNFRSLSLIYNFSPSCPAVTKVNPELVSPAARLNGRVYHAHWLENLLIATSLGGAGCHRNPL